MKKHLATITATVMAFAALAVAAPAARADGKVSCTILEIEASNTDSPAQDPELKPLEKKFRKPPFTSWNTFKRLGSYTAELESLKPSALALVGGKAELLLRDITTSKSKKPRAAFGITLDDQTGKRVLDTKVQVDLGDWLVVGRSMKGDKGWWLALTCK